MDLQQLENAISEALQQPHPKQIKVAVEVLGPRRLLRIGERRTVGRWPIHAGCPRRGRAMKSTQIAQRMLRALDELRECANGRWIGQRTRVAD
jgi:hypothetical protein